MDFERQTESDGATVDIVIVNYCTEELVLRCVQSISNTALVSLNSVVVVDNASPDGSGHRLAEAMPLVRVVRSEKNGGFGAGVNLGVACTRAPYVMVVNPDTLFLPSTLSGVVEAMENNDDLGLLGLELVNTDYSLQYSARRFYSLFDILLRRSPLGKWGVFAARMKEHLMIDQDRSKIFDADWVMGTGIVVRRAAFDALGGMDDGYFLYFEDVDLCARMWRDGWTVKCLPSALLIHDHQRSSAAGLASWAGRQHLKSMIRFWTKFGIPLFRAPSRR